MGICLREENVSISGPLGESGSKERRQIGQSHPGTRAYISPYQPLLLRAPAFRGCGEVLLCLSEYTGAEPVPG